MSQLLFCIVFGGSNFFLEEKVEMWPVRVCVLSGLEKDAEKSRRNCGLELHFRNFLLFSASFRRLWGTGWGRRVLVAGWCCGGRDCFRMSVLNILLLFAVAPVSLLGPVVRGGAWIEGTGGEVWRVVVAWCCWAVVVALR